MEKDIGTLIDELITANIKLFLLIDKSNKLAKEGRDIPNETAQKRAFVENKRRELINELNKCYGQNITDIRI